MIALQGESLTRRCRNRVGAGGICGVGKSMATACAEEVGRMELDEAVLAAAGKLGGYYDCANLINKQGCAIGYTGNNKSLYSSYYKFNNLNINFYRR